MGLKDMVANALGTAFAAVGDLKQDITLTRRVGTTYDPTTGIPTELKSSYSLTGIYLPGMTPAKVRAPSGNNPSEFDGADEPMPSGQLLIRASEIPVRPKDLDEVTLANGSKFVVQSVEVDPTGSLYTLKLA